MKLQIKGPIIENGEKAIYEYFGMDACCPRDITHGLEKAVGQHVEVEINSPGGSVFAGSEIYTALRSYSGSVLIRIVGFAGSAASVAAMARESEISPTAQMMVHNVAALASGDYREMDKTSGILQNANRAIAAAYMGKSGMDEAEVLAMMDKETWLTAEQAVKKGLVDRVMFGELVAVSQNGGILPREVIERTRALLGRGKQARILQAKNQLKLLRMKGRV